MITAANANNSVILTRSAFKGRGGEHVPAYPEEQKKARSRYNKQKELGSSMLLRSSLYATTKRGKLTVLKFSRDKPLRSLEKGGLAFCKIHLVFARINSQR